MTKYWALDYVNDVTHECEPVYCDQLYYSEEDATRASAAIQQPDLYEVVWYSIKDLEEIYDGPVTIDENLKVHKVA